MAAMHAGMSGIHLSMNHVEQASRVLPWRFMAPGRVRSAECGIGQGPALRCAPRGARELVSVDLAHWIPSANPPLVLFRSANPAVRGSGGFVRRNSGHDAPAGKDGIPFL